MANIITCARIVCSIILLSQSPFSPAFFFLYIFAGITDMIDGTVARLTNSVSSLGSHLDSISDLVFFAVCAYKLVPLLNIPKWIFFWVSVIAAVKILSYCIGLYKYRQPMSLHTLLNKICGFLLFLFPLTVSIINAVITASIICVIATCASVHELYSIISGNVV